MDYDEALLHLGGFGRYQLVQFLLVCVPGAIYAITILGTIFTVGVPKHRCAVSENDTHYIPVDDHLKRIVNTTIPRVLEGGEWTYSKCFTYNLTGPDMDMESRWNQTQLKCDRWVYDDTIFIDSAVSEFDLVCDNAYFAPLPSSLTFTGLAVGTFVFGQMSDRYGRKPVVFGLCVACGIISFVSSWSPNVIMLAALGCFAGVSAGALFAIAFVMAVENVPVSHRKQAGIALQFSFTFGSLWSVACAYLIRRWRYTNGALSAICFLYIPAWWCLDESCRWLLTNGKPDQAEALLRKVARINRAKDPEAILKSLVKTCKVPKTVSFLNVVKSPVLLCRTLVVWYEWLVITVLYYVVLLNLKSLGGNIYANFALIMSFEIPTNLLCIFMLNKIGRRVAQATSVAVGAVSGIASIFVITYGGPSLNWLLITLGVIGKSSGTGGFAFMYLITGEVFPTVVRNVAVGSANMASRVAGILIPYLILAGDLIGGDFGRSFPLMVAGVMAVIAVGLIVLIPETRNRRLPETIQDGKMLGRSPKTTKKENESVQGNGNLESNIELL